jgi:ribosomal protein L44E
MVKHYLEKGVMEGMIEFPKNLYCDKCGKETEHMVREDALEIEYICTECNNGQEIIKSFF